MRNDDGEGLVILDPINNEDRSEGLVELDQPKKSNFSDLFEFNIPKNPVERLKRGGEELKEFLGGVLESEPARMLRSAGEKGQAGLLGLAGLLTGQDLSKYRHFGGDPLTEEERKSPESMTGRIGGEIAGGAALPLGIENLISRSVPALLRESAALGGSGAISGSYENPENRLEGSGIGALENLATLGGAKLIGKGIKGAKNFYNSIAKETPEKIESFLRGAFEDPFSPASQTIKKAYGSPVAESENLQRIMGEKYQNHALEAGKHINDEGIIRPLSKGIGSEERNPVYNSLEERLKDLDKNKAGFSLSKNPYREAIEKAKKGLSQTTKQSLPADFLEEDEIITSPLEAFKRYRQLNRRVLNRPHSDPDLVRAASDLKKGILNQLEEGSKRNKSLENWLKDFKKANRGFATSSKYEKRYKEIEDSLGGLAPKDTVDRLLRMIDRNPESLKTAIRDFGEIRNPLKNAILHKVIGKDALSYHPVKALEAFETLSPNVRRLLFDKPELNMLNKLAAAKEKIGTLSARRSHEFGSHAAHALGLTGEALGVPFSQGAALPWLSRIAEEAALRNRYTRGRNALLDEIERMSNRSEEIEPEVSRNESKSPFLASILTNIMRNSTKEDKK